MRERERDKLDYHFISFLFIIWFIIFTNFGIIFDSFILFYFIYFLILVVVLLIAVIVHYLDSKCVKNVP